MRRRGRGEGGLRKRPDGRWEGSFVGSDGRRHFVYAATRREAHARLAGALREIEAGLYVTGQSQTVADFLTRWLARADHLRPITRKRYGQLIRLQIIPHLGYLDMRKVQPQHVAENEALVRAVLESLCREPQQGLRYAVFRLDDGVGFLHLVELPKQGIQRTCRWQCSSATWAGL